MFVCSVSVLKISRFVRTEIKHLLNRLWASYEVVCEVRRPAGSFHPWLPKLRQHLRKHR